MSPLITAQIQPKIAFRLATSISGDGWDAPSPRGWNPWIVQGKDATIRLSHCPWRSCAAINVCMEKSAKRPRAN